MPIDVLIPLGHGSPFGNDELRYALRSIERHMRNVARVVIIGERPDWLSDAAVHWPYVEPDYGKEARIAHKVLWACEHTDLSDEFLFGNDDHFFLQDADAERYPFFHKGLIAKQLSARVVGHYRRSLDATLTALNQAGLPTFNFDIHTPIRYERSKFAALRDWWDRSAIDRDGFVVKSVYANVHGITGELLRDCKLHTARGAAQVRESVAGRHVFSVGDGAWRRGALAFLNERFPNPSRFEK